MFGYHVPAPNEAILISGRKQRGEDSLQFKIVTGHGVFVMPIASKASRLSLAMQEAEVVEDCFTQQGLTLAVEAVIAFKVGDDHESIASAARRFQGDQGQMPTLVGRIFSGHRRLSCVDVQITSMSTEKLDEALTDDRHTRNGLAVEVGLLLTSEQLLAVSRPGETGLPQQGAKDLVGPVGVALDEAADHQRWDRVVVQVGAQLCKVSAVANLGRIGEQRVEAAEVAVVAQSFDLVVDQRDAVGVQQLLGQPPCVLGEATGPPSAPGSLPLQSCHRLGPYAAVVLAQRLLCLQRWENHQVGADVGDECGALLGLDLPRPR